MRLRLFLCIACIGLFACKAGEASTRPLPPRKTVDDVASAPQRLQVLQEAVCVDEGDAVRCWGDEAADHGAQLGQDAERLFFGCVRTADDGMRCPQRDWPPLQLPGFAGAPVTASNYCLVDRDGRHACLDLDRRTWHTALPALAARQATGRADSGCLIDQTGTLACWRQAEAVSPLDRGQRLRRLAEHSDAWRGCAVTEADDVVCWRGDEVERPDVRRLGAAVDVSFAFEHACARLVDGRVACFGSNCSGQLGTGDRRSSDTAVLVPGLAAADEVRAGPRATCARTRDGALWCWGRAEVFGGPRPGPRARPEPVRGLSGAIALSVAAHQSCAVTAEGAVLCWGRWYAGAVGPTPECLAYEPVRLEGSGTAVDVALGEDIGCVRDREGRATCWRAQGAFASTAASIILPGVVKDMSVGTGNVCAIDPRGAVRCWSFAESDPARPAAPPERGPARTIALPEPAAQIDAGGDRTCAVTRAGRVYCWASSPDPQAPVKLEALAIRGAVEVRTDSATTCVRRRSGSVACVGEAGASDRALAEFVDVRALAIGVAGVCALGGDAMIRCAGRLDPQLGAEATGAVGTATIATGVPTRSFGLGERHGCALGDDGRVRCWGAQFEQGQLGDGVTPFASTPVQVHGPTPPRR